MFSQQKNVCGQVGEYLERMARYDLMLGVTSAEAFVLLNQLEMELGLETEGRFDDLL